MGEVGCPIDQAGLWKIVKANPPRKVAAEELATLSEVLDIPVGDLLKPLEVALGDEAQRLLEQLNVKRSAYLAAAQDVQDTIVEITRLLAAAGRLDYNRYIGALAEAERAMINLLDLMLEAEAELRCEDFEQWPDSSELYGHKR